MVAVIFAGGRGGRFSAVTGGANKHLVDLGGLPIVQWGMVSLRRAGIGDVAILTNRGEERTFREVARVVGFEEIEVVASSSPDLALGEVLLEAEALVGRNEFVLYLGDNVFFGGIEEVIRQFIMDSGSNRVLLASVADVGAFGSAFITDGKLISVEEKPRAGGPGIAVTGLGRYTAEVFRVLEGAGQDAMPFDLTWLHNQLIGMDALKYTMWREGRWFDVGIPAVYHELQRAFVSRLELGCNGRQLTG